MLTRQQIEELTKLVFKTFNGRDFSLLKGKITSDVSFDFPGSSLIESERRVILFLNSFCANPGFVSSFPRL